MADLTVSNLDVSYGDIQVLWNINLTVPQGKIVSLVGSNGAGKTTLLKTISGLLQANRGEIRYASERINGKATEHMISRGIIQIPEGRRLFYNMDVEENLIMGAYARVMNSIEHKKALDQVYDLFPKLMERKRQKAGSLSGGEQQMLAIGRGLMGNPELLLIDEMSLGLAPVIVDDLIGIIRLLNEKGTTIFLIEQDVQLALENADHAYVMETGRIVMEGPAAELLNRPDIRKAYLGI